MKRRGVSSKVTVMLAFTVLHGVPGCDDVRGDEQAIDDVGSHDDAEGEILAQRAPEAAAPGGANAANSISVAAVGAVGPGCPPGSWSADRVPDGSAFTLSFNSFSVETPVTKTPITKSLACTFNLQLRTPKNVSYAVAAIQYFGYTNLSAGMKANLLANYTFRGGGYPAVKQFRRDFPVPSDSTYAFNDQVSPQGSTSASAAASPGAAGLGWARCNYASTLQIQTQLTIESTSQTRPGIVTLDNFDGRVNTGMRVVLKTGGCPSDS